MAYTTKEKILIANRGESACRIIRTAQKMGLKTVAVYSDVDSSCLHVQMADEAVLLGGALASESYLNMRKIIEAAKKTGAKYIHPGSGFLSENPKFAQMVERMDLIFVGPPVDAMKQLGDKIKSKKIAKSAGVNIIPGLNDVLENAKQAREASEKIGFPVMLKASAGGGGKGIRIVFNREDIEDAFESVQREAKNSFGDDRIFVEKYIENPRHIEVQVLGDMGGNVVCLGERECSIQRSHQKLIEESPSPFIDERTRKKMYAQATALSKKVGYYSAGTVEFIVDKNKNFYFMEMNTRLQVEHPITEYVTGLDLVELMIKVSKGEELPFRQADIKLNGWAIESRICAEDPTRGFLPSSGRINKYIEPPLSDNVRVDTGVYEGFTTSMYYDSLLAKLITYGKDRKEAIQTMREALGSFFINGISHNISFLETIMYNERFQSGDYSTSFIKEEFSDGFSGTEIEKKSAGILIGVALFMFVKNQKRFINISGRVDREVEFSDKFVVDISGMKFLCNVSDTSRGLSVEYGNGFSLVNSTWQFGSNIFRGEVNSKAVSVKINSDNHAGEYSLQYMGSTAIISVRSTRVSELERFMPVVDRTKKSMGLKAPLTGKLVKIRVEEGEEIKAGMALLSIEAMKMENIIRAENDLTIKKIHKKEGDLVNASELLIEFE